MNFEQQTYPIAFCWGCMYFRFNDTFTWVGEEELCSKCAPSA
jgi:hypothetical protein